VPAVLVTLYATILVALVDGVALPTVPLAAVATLLALAVLAQVMLPVGPDQRPALALGAVLHARARRRRLPRAIDPDSAGRPRPRAPSAPSV
jgi:hypothetical protein